MRILLVDDHPILRAGLRELLGRRPGVEIHEATDGHSAIRVTDKVSPDVVVMDLAMPGLNGIDTTRRILADHPETKVIALSAFTDRRMVVDALRAGALGYVPKHAAFEELSAAVDQALAGNVYISPSIAKTVLEALDAHHGGAWETLTGREREVLQLIAEGDSTKEIAMKLGVSVKTVETHRRQLMEKLHIYSVAELTKFAIRENLTQVDY